MTGPRRFNSLVVAGRLVKSSSCATFALPPSTVRPCTVLLQYTLQLHSLTVRPCQSIQYTLPPTCSTVVTTTMRLKALYCPDTVQAASIYFGLVFSSVHAAYLRPCTVLLQYMPPLFILALYCLQYTLPA